MSIHLIQPRTWFDSNVYVVSGERPLLVDTGTGLKVEETLQDIDAILEGRKVTSIVLTHRHYDHVGGAWRIQLEHGSKTYMLPADAEPVRGGDSDSTLGLQYGGKIMPMEIEDAAEGMIISTGDHSFEVISTPGHTVGALVLYERETGILISGDTVFSGGVGRWDLPTGDRGALVRSLRKLLELELTDLYPGHGPVAEGKARDQVEYALRSLGE